MGFEGFQFLLAHVMSLLENRPRPLSFAPFTIHLSVTLTL